MTTLHLDVLLHPVIATETDSAIVRPDAMATATATVLDRRDEMTVIDTEMDETEDGRPDVMEEAETTEKTRKRKTSPRRRKRNLSLRLAVRNL